MGFVKSGFVGSGFVQGESGEIKIKTIIYPLVVPHLDENFTFNDFIGSTIDKVISDLNNKETVNVKYIGYVVTEFGSRLIPSTYLFREGFRVSDVGTSETMVEGIFDKAFAEKEDSIVKNISSILLSNLNENQLNIIANKVIEVMQLNNIDTINYSPTIGNVSLFKDGETVTVPFTRNPDGSLQGKISLNGEYTILVSSK